MSPIASMLDRAVTRAVSSRYELGTRRADDQLLIERAQQAVESLEGFSEDDFFQVPSPISPLLSRSPTGNFSDLSWRSQHTLRIEPCQVEYQGYPLNSEARVRLFGGAQPRPIAVLIHGYMGGVFALEQRIWPIRWLSGLGYDTALFTLPFHGARSAAAGASPAFPQTDILFNVEAFRQSVTDLLDFVQYLKNVGHPQVGLMGMSLGGYVAALAATVQPELAFLIPIIPLACLADFASEQKRVPRGSQQALRYHSLLRRAYRLVSPLARSPQIDAARVLVVAGKADRITPAHHARSLARHFSAPLEAWPGGHLLQFGRAASLQRIGVLLREVCKA